jgi:hypothetical protein
LKAALECRKGKVLPLSEAMVVPGDGLNGLAGATFLAGNGFRRWWLQEPGKISQAT